MQLGTALNVVTAPDVIARLTNIEAGMASMQNSILAMGATLDAMRGMMALTGKSFFYTLEEVHTYQSIAAVLAHPGSSEPAARLREFMQGIPQRPNNPPAPSPPVPDSPRHERTPTPLPGPSLQTPVHHDSTPGHSPPPQSPTQHAGSIGDNNDMDVDGEEHHTPHENPQAMPAGPAPSLATAPSEDVDMGDETEVLPNNNNATLAPPEEQLVTTAPDSASRSAPQEQTAPAIASTLTSPDEDTHATPQDAASLGAPPAGPENGAPQVTGEYKQ